MRKYFRRYHTVRRYFRTFEGTLFTLLACTFLIYLTCLLVLFESTTTVVYFISYESTTYFRTFESTRTTTLKLSKVQRCTRVRVLYFVPSYESTTRATKVLSRVLSKYFRVLSKISSKVRARVRTCTVRVVTIVSQSLLRQFTLSPLAS